MTTRLYYATNRDEAAAPIEELSRVRLRRDLESDDGQTVPRGSSGTVLSVYKFGTAYCVEFTQPFQALVTAESADVETIEGEGRDDLAAAARKPDDRQR